MAKQQSGRAQYVDQTRYDDTVNTVNEQLEPEEDNDYRMLGGINRTQNACRTE